MNTNRDTFKKIYIEITNMCNLKCEFCIPCGREARMMSLIEFEEVIKKVCNYTKVVTLHVKGEPLLHKNLEGIFCFPYHNSIFLSLFFLFLLLFLVSFPVGKEREKKITP